VSVWGVGGWGGVLGWWSGDLVGFGEVVLWDSGCVVWVVFLVCEGLCVFIRICGVLVCVLVGVW